MPKFTIEFEAPDLTDFVQQILSMVGSTPATVAAVVGVMEARAAEFPDDEQPEPAPVANGDAGKRGRGRPKKTTVTPVETSPPATLPATPTKLETPPETREMLQASTQALDPGLTKNLPSLDLLKAAVTTAVRQAQKGEGDKAILALLPQFKTETGLDFIMNAKDEHRLALYGLVQQAGLTVG